MGWLLDRLQTLTGVGLPGRRKVYFFAIAAGLFVLGQILRNVQTLRKIEDFAWRVVADLADINPLNFFMTFIDHLGCAGTKLNFLGIAEKTCDPLRLFWPPNYLTAFLTATFGDLSRAPNASAFLVFAITIATTLALSIYLWRRYVKEALQASTMVDAAAITMVTAFLTPFVATVLMTVSAALFAIFGGLVGLAILLLTDYRWIKNLFDNARRLRKYATSKSLNPWDVAKDLGDSILGGGGAAPSDSTGSGGGGSRGGGSAGGRMSVGDTYINPLGAVESIKGTANWLDRAYTWARDRLGRKPGPK